MIDNRDPRAVRTREKLVAAFREEIRDRDPGAMSVAGLARAAGVNRTSFYEHFASPEDLAVHALSELFDLVRGADVVMRSGRSVSAAEASRRALRDIVSFVHARRDVYVRLLGPGAAPRLVRAVSDAFTEQTVRALERIESRPPDADPYVTARFLAAGVLDAIGAWLAGRPPDWTPDQLVEALVRCLPGWLTTDRPVAGRDDDRKD